MHIPQRLHEASRLAYDLFGRDARKKSEVPVLSHLFSVCAMVQFDGGSEDEAIAALLHDTLEDKPEFITREEIADRFGKHVLELVEISSDTPSDYRGGPKPPWKERKQNYLNHVRQADPRMLRITIADKIDNARAIIADYQRMGDAVWLKFNAGREDQIWYYREAVRAYEEAGCTGELMDELRRLVSRLIDLTGERN